MNDTDARAGGRFENDADLRTDRILLGTAILAAFLLLLALAASVFRVWSDSREGIQDLTDVAATARAQSLVRELADDRMSARTIDARELGELRVVLEGPIREHASTATRALLDDAAAAFRNDLASPASPTATQIVRDRASLESALASVRGEIETAGEERSGARPAGALISAAEIVSAGIVLLLAAAIRLRNARIAAQRFAAMLERMLADMTRTTIDLVTESASEERRAVAGDRAMLTVDHRLLVVEPYSDELCEFFELADLEGYPIGALLRRIAPEGDRAAAVRFAETLFDPAFSDDRLSRHPLKSVVRDGEPFGLTFTRVRDRGEIASVVVSFGPVSAPVEARERPVAPAPVGDMSEIFDAFARFATPETIDAVIVEIVAYTRVLGKTLRSSDIARHLSNIHRATLTFIANVERFEFTYLTERLRAFDIRTIEAIADPPTLGGASLPYAIVVAEITSELEAFRALASRSSQAI